MKNLRSISSKVEESGDSYDLKSQKLRDLEDY